MQRVLIAALLYLFGYSTALAEPSFARMYKGTYGYMPSCNACHRDGGGSPLNEYGKQFEKAGMKIAAFAAIEGADADGDGASNGDEAKAKANPGSDDSTPDNKGDWLDVSNLIPKEVQVLFPGVRSYLPKDAILTDSEIARAKALGATLGEADENTIYIPVKDKKAAGTAVIVPVKQGDKQFFLVVATDTQLNLTHIVPFNTKEVPGAVESGVYKKLVGKAVKDLPSGDPSSLDGAITDSVKRAGTLLYVRLKKG